VETDKLIHGSVELNGMFAALRRVAGGIRRDFGEIENLQQTLPSARGFMKKAAERIEGMILSDLSLVRPRAGLLTPNASHDGDGRDEFVLALSGAENFVRGIGHFAITLALRTNGETKIGLVYSPIDDKLYYAEAGAFLFAPFHSQRLAVSKNADMFGRGTGCVALDLAYVAAGKFDRLVIPATDYAELCAGEFLVLQAGGVIEQRGADLVVSNGM
jgi:myo-inositol-1(or 4)-monophosphatase